MRLTRRGRLAVTITVTVLSIAVACSTFSFLRTPGVSALGTRTPPPPPCRVDVGSRTLSWSHERAMTATTVAAVGRRIGAADNGIAAAVSRGLRGRDHTVDAVAAREIYRTLPPPATPSPASRALAAALLGMSGPALTCTVRETPDPVRAEPIGPAGLTARAEALRIAMRATFGKQIIGGFEPGGVTTGHMRGSAHYEGRAIDVFFRPISDANQQLGWQQAQWAVAHAQRLQIATVIFDGRVWSAEQSPSGWHDYVYPDGPTRNPILLHEDHVHVDVLRGLGAT